MNFIAYTDLLNKLDDTRRKAFEFFCDGIRTQSVFEIKTIIVFGSITKRTLYITSDIDIAVVSDNFVPVSWTERIEILKSFNFDSHTSINPLGITSLELVNYEYPSVVKVIRNQGFKIIF